MSMDWRYFFLNETIRHEAKKRGVFLWEVAYRLGMTDGNFSRRLRRELPEAEKKEILRIIHEIAAAKETHHVGK